MTLHARFLSPGGSTLPAGVIADFQRLVYEQYAAAGRHFPWRETNDPYHIFLSEIMLQQTQVERVRVKYREFLDLFPHVSALSRAPLEAVLTAWQGLGYNRRALALHRAAQTIAGCHGAEVPRTVPELEALPGVGPYTARAIAAFAFRMPTVFIETNIRSVYIHHFCGDREGVQDSELLPLVGATLDRDRPREWYYALMDYGVVLKRELVNPGRRSAHHVRQSLFKGSNRELRSHILKTVLASPGLTREMIMTRLGGVPERVDQNLRQLEREGFLQKKGDFFFIS